MFTFSAALARLIRREWLNKDSSGVRLSETRHGEMAAAMGCVYVSSHCAEEIPCSPSLIQLKFAQ